MENTKNDKYTFRCNGELKEKFKILCKIGNVSPSDVLQNVMIEFCDNAERIMNMQDITELRQLFIDKMNIADNEIKKIEENPTFKR